MGWEDRQYEKFSGGRGESLGSRILHAIFRPGENPAMWGVPVARVAGVSVRISLLFILISVVQLTTAMFRGGLAFTAVSLSCLFVLVLLHEFGHITACRMVRGDADEILMWPLGGLAKCLPPHTWRANLWTTAGGPLVNVALMPILGLGVLGVGGKFEHLFFNFFEPTRTLLAFISDSGTGSSSSFVTYAKYALWHAYFANLMLLGFNVIVPMYPMDGARLWQALLWKRMGYAKSLSIMVSVGIGAAVVMGLAGIAISDNILVMLAVFGGLTCWQERQRLIAAQAVGGQAWGYGDGEDEAEAWRGGTSANPPRESRRVTDPFTAAARKQQQEHDRQIKHQEEVDRILAKIAKSGMGSLSRGEKKTLEEETARKRGG